MSLNVKARLSRMFRHGRCLDVAIDHGIANEPDFLVGLEDMTNAMLSLIAARPDAIQVNYGQADGAGRQRHGLWPQRISA